jgi:hypothetical protein
VGAFNDLFARLDPDPRVRGKQFEHVCKWFLTNDPMYKTTLRKVWLWKEWTGRWGIDAGIDLVAEDYEGQLWAIQCKAYKAESSITKADVDTFLSESSRAATGSTQPSWPARECRRRHRSPGIVRPPPTPRRHGGLRRRRPDELRRGQPALGPSAWTAQVSAQNGKGRGVTTPLDALLQALRPASRGCHLLVASVATSCSTPRTAIGAVIKQRIIEKEERVPLDCQ